MVVRGQGEILTGKHCPQMEERGFSNCSKSCSVVRFCVIDLISLILHDCFEAFSFYNHSNGTQTQRFFIFNNFAHSGHYCFTLLNFFFLVFFLMLIYAPIIYCLLFMYAYFC